MNRGRLFTRISILALLATVLFFSPPGPARVLGDDTETVVIPIIANNTPTFDGNSSSFGLEWVNASKTTVNVGGDAGFNGDLFVQINGTHLFIMLNFSRPSFIPVNDTIPTNSPLSYNNATHDWFAFEFDNDLTRKEYGTADAPHDLIVVDRYNSSVVDAFVYMNGTKDNSVPIVENDTYVGGFDNTGGVRANFSDAGDNVVVLELYKELNSEDAKGYDININDSILVSFRILAWQNASVEFNTTTVLKSDWLNYRLNQTGTGFTVAPVSNATILFDTRGIDNAASLKGFETVLKSYGVTLNNQTDDVTLETLQNNNLTILVVGNNDFSDDEIEAYRQFVRDGGSLFLVVSKDVSESAQKLLETFGLQTVSNGQFLFGKVGENGTKTATVSATTIKGVAPFLDGASPLTDRIINTLSLYASGLNLTLLKQNDTLFAQEYLLYDILKTPADMFLDSNTDGVRQSNETLPGNITYFLGVDLQFGGRLAAMSTDLILTNQSFVINDNDVFFLRLLPWLAKFNGFLQVNSTITDRYRYSQSDTIMVKTGVYQNLNETASDATVQVLLSQAGNVFARYNLTLNATATNYTHELSFALPNGSKIKGYVDIVVEAKQAGLGFARGEATILIEREDPTYNDVSPFFLLIFFVSVGVVAVFAVFVYRKLRTFELEPESTT